SCPHLHILPSFPTRRSSDLICCALSSPEIYKILNSFHCNAICRNNVDFPIPGSPAIKVMLPAINPPPTQRLNSKSGVRYLNSSRSEEHTSELQSRENLVCRL